MQAIVEAGEAEVIAVCDPSEPMREAATALVPGARTAGSLDALLEMDLDAIVIATPSALHAEQSVAALERGLAVFCQKPLGRTAEETARVVAAARRSDRLLHVDLSYRQTEALAAIRALARSGELGAIYAAELAFHNAYGPDKAWFYDPELAGGGCVMDLGVHLVDAAMWVFDFPEVRHVTSRLFERGRLVKRGASIVEDHAFAELELASGASVRLACSWNLSAGCDAIISVRLHGTRGGASMHNVGGSFYDFVAERYTGSRAERLVDPPDPWGGRAAVAFVRRLAKAPSFDPSATELITVAALLDRIYGRPIAPMALTPRGRP
jgi:predicted dehydrogenase